MREFAASYSLWVKGIPVNAPSMAHRLSAEFIGTFWLVLGGCGAAVFAADPAGDNSVGIG